VKAALVGDIGGTNARFALWKDNQLHNVQVFPTADYTSPEQAIGAYLSAQGLAGVSWRQSAWRWPGRSAVTSSASPTATGA